ncbi:isoprenylcysteine carboxylmethyltransferase family protein [bacterium]|nr:isoprenylcysteine carboxylmethyltransferase family protein [bacterium]
METPAPDSQKKKATDGKPLPRIGQFLLKVLAFFVILEPIWMLLPFAGFLYGSGLRIQVLARNPETAWLTHFVFPVLTLGPTGPILVVVGFGIFLVGAGQIYWAKFRHSGMVTKGLYAYVRHPQYTALTFFGVGLLLAWGRAIMFLAFFLMMFLYYFLAKSEERKCIELFGDEYVAYRDRMSFSIPGDKVISRLWARLPTVPMPRALRVVVSFVLTFCIAFGLLWLITTIRTHVRTVPFMTTTVPFSTEETKGEPGPELVEGRKAGVPFVASERLLVVRGPWRNASAPGFAETVLRRSLRSDALAGFLEFLDEPSRDVAFVFCTPYDPPKGDGNVGERFVPTDSLRRGPMPDPQGPDRARLIVMRCELPEGATITEALAEKSKRRIVQACVARIDLSRPAGEDMVVEGPDTMGRPGGPVPKELVENRWDFLMVQIAERESLVPKPKDTPIRPVPRPSSSTDLILSQAPILRTRIQPGSWFGRHHEVDHAATGGKSENRFARDILDRLAASPSFRERLMRFGAGGDLVPVAFPRPGPNWYIEYHVRYERTEDGRWHRGGGTPQISVFVMLVRQKPGAAHETLFDESLRGERDILGAFIAELDFGIEPPKDPVHEIVIIGPRRNLEERWTFFLSGL